MLNENLPEMLIAFTTILSKFTIVFMKPTLSQRTRSRSNCMQYDISIPCFVSILSSTTTVLQTDSRVNEYMSTHYSCAEFHRVKFMEIQKACISDDPFANQ